MQASYWGGNGKYQALANELNKLIPDQGAVRNTAKNKHLERFRKACNAYYDLNNNGGGNHPQAICRLFGVRLGAHRDWSRGKYDYLPSLYVKVEAAMDQIVLAAAVEQGVDLPTTA